jgi:hypothetical protein
VRRAARLVALAALALPASADAADSLVPGAVDEGRRGVWGLGQVKVYDGGADGAAATTADNTLFMDQGVIRPLAHGVIVHRVTAR